MLRNLTINFVRGRLATFVVSIFGASVTSATVLAQILPTASYDLSSLDAAASRQAEAGLIGAARAAKTGSMAKVGPTLAKLHQAYDAHLRRGDLEPPARAFAAADPAVRVVADKVVIDAVAASDPETLLQDLTAAGLTEGSLFGRVVSGKLPIAALDTVAGLDSLQFARPALARAHKGTVTSKGVKAMDIAQARMAFGVKGRGITVGVLSDSFNCLGGAPFDTVRGDLPNANRREILDDSACPGTDEGRAIMQVVADVAPLARQAFHTAFNGQADFANGIVELAEEAGAQVVVDDVLYYSEPMFQHGIIAQAVNQVKAAGVAYFSSAGNAGRNSWESGAEGFVSAGTTGAFDGLRHDFDPGAGIDDLQSVMLGTGTTFFAFQWDQPFASVSGPPGSASDMDIILYLPGGTFVDLGGFTDNLGGDAIEVFGVINSGPPTEVEIGLELFAGPPPGFMKYVIFDPGSLDVSDPPSSFVLDFPTDSGTVYGHANAKGAMAVGAAFWRDTPSFGVSPPEVQPFSSAGGTPILFNRKGFPIAPTLRQKPEIIAVDGAITTFFGGRDSFGFADPAGTHFFGTSASAPHAAGLAALMLEAKPKLKPGALYNILKKKTIDMDDPSTPEFDVGFDFATGFGLVDGFRAVKAADKRK